MPSVIYRLKRSFTAGELSPLMLFRTENDRYKYGCRQLKNMVVLPQGPAKRREGFEYKFDLTTLVGDALPDEAPIMIPFVFDKDQAYAIILFNHTESEVVDTRAVFATGDGLLEDPEDPGNPYVFSFTGAMDLPNLVYKQSKDIVYIAQPDRIQIELKRLAEAEWSANEIAFTDQPSDWSEENGYPQFVDFFEQRIVYGCTWKRPQTLWFSKSADFYDFGVSSPVVDSDAVTLTLGTTQNRMRWTNAAKQLLVGTLGDEWSVSGSGYQPLSFESNKMSRETNVGSEKIPSLMIGPVTLYVERHGRKVNQFVYDFNSDTYDSVDLSVLAPHLTESNYITNWCYQQSPYGIVWCTRDDGKAIALTFKREHRVTGWHVHDTDGKFLKLCSIPGDREDDVWAIIEREINGYTKWYLEKKRPEFKSDSALDAYFLDSCVVLDSEEYITTISNLGHLEGKTVSILADGCVVADQVVVNGQITLDIPAKRVVIGLPYDSIIEPILLDIGLDDGTSLGRISRIIELNIMLHNSLLFEYGHYNTYGEAAFEEKSFRDTSDITGQQMPLFTGYKSVDFQEGYDSDERVIIRQRRPLPLTVVGLCDVVEVTE